MEREPRSVSSNWDLDVVLHGADWDDGSKSVSYTHLRAHETVLDIVCRLLLEKTKENTHRTSTQH